MYTKGQMGPIPNWQYWDQHTHTQTHTQTHTLIHSGPLDNTFNLFVRGRLHSDTHRI
jgi:hypothetical protein